MNISQAKQIPLRNLVEHLGGRFSHEGRSGETWFFSPFRPDEKTASFKIDDRKNEWHDFGHVSAGHTGQGSGGDIINLWCDYYAADRKQIKEALKGLEEFAGRGIAPIVKRPPTASKKPAVEASESRGEVPRFKLLKEPGRISLSVLKAELQRRGISMTTASPFLKQASIQDTKTNRKYHGFAFLNDKGGVEISIPNPGKNENFKTCIGAKSPSSFSIDGSNSVIVFEGFFDFLTWMEMNKGRDPNCHIYILNSLSFIGQFAQQVIDKKGAVSIVIDMLDNDPAGEDARIKLADIIVTADLEFHAKNQIYKGFKDLNSWWTDSPTARQDWQKQFEPKNKVYYDSAWDQVTKKTNRSPE
jgi:hypothetical protein